MKSVEDCAVVTVDDDDDGADDDRCCVADDTSRFFPLTSCLSPYAGVSRTTHGYYASFDSRLRSCGKYYFICFLRVRSRGCP